MSHINSYRRDNRTGALINKDKAGYKNARLRKNHVKRLAEERVRKDKELNELKQRLERLESFIMQGNVQSNVTG